MTDLNFNLKFNLKLNLKLELGIVVLATESSKYTVVLQFNSVK